MKKNPREKTLEKNKPIDFGLKGMKMNVKKKRWWIVAHFFISNISLSGKKVEKWINCLNMCMINP